MNLLWIAICAFLTSAAPSSNRFTTMTTILNNNNITISYQVQHQIRDHLDPLVASSILPPQKRQPPISFADGVRKIISQSGWRIVIQYYNSMVSSSKPWWAWSTCTWPSTYGPNSLPCGTISSPFPTKTSCGGMFKSSARQQWRCRFRWSLSRSLRNECWSRRSGVLRAGSGRIACAMGSWFWWGCWRRVLGVDISWLLWWVS